MKWKKVAGFWKPNKKGDSIEGELMKCIEHAGDYDSKAYLIETDSEILVAMGSTVLDRKMREALEVGDFVKIVFLGEVDGEKQKYKDFDVSKGAEYNGG